MSGRLVIDVNPMATFDAVTDEDAVCIIEQGQDGTSVIRIPIKRFRELAASISEDTRRPIGSIGELRRRLDAREAGGLPDQRSTTEQLQDVVRVADLLGMYDAADAIRRWRAQP